MGKYYTWPNSLSKDATQEELEKTAIEAYRWENIPPLGLATIDSDWGKFKKEFCPPYPPDNHEWSWPRKVAKAGKDHLTIGLAVAVSTEGLIMMSLNTRRAQHPKARDLPILYVEYLEAAPWNQVPYVGKNNQHLIGVGKCLLQIAIEESMERGCEGRLALHSLNDARKFYKNHGFTNLGLDWDEGLDYLEKIP